MTRSWLVVSLLLVGCARSRIDRDHDVPEPPPAMTARTAAERAKPPEPVGFTDVKMDGDLTAFKLTGVKEHRLKMVFVPGMCVHPVGYVQAFQYTAASRGDLVTLQGETAPLLRTS